jgi:hypothetical protein
MRLAQDDEMVNTLAPDRSDQPFGKAIVRSSQLHSYRLIRRKPSWLRMMRKGMAAWIKDLGQERPVREDITPTASSAMCVPEGIERSLVDIIAAMAFATALEGVP